MAMTKSVDLIESMQRLFPRRDQDDAIAELLLERAQRYLVRYQSNARGFSDKYGLNFDSFREAVLSSEPDEATEQDYFDWELTVTGSIDMQDEIVRLCRLIKS